jgi:hypothetical protein
MHQLYRRFVVLVPWLARCTNANITVTRLPGAIEFSVEAEWEQDGVHQQYRKVYQPELLRQERFGCTKDLARRFIRETLEKRGI